jgi:dUTPase
MSGIENEIRTFASKQNMAILKIVFDEQMPEVVKNEYISHINKHNLQILNDPYPNSGFDLFIPNCVNFLVPFETVFINHLIKCEMVYKYNNFANYLSSPFDVVPRSSISKTPLLMANHIGIIDAGYRGDLLAAVRCLPQVGNTGEMDCRGPIYKIQQNMRLFQVCHPMRCPIYVKIVNLTDLSTTARGEGGFGSTGV